MLGGLWNVGRPVEGRRAFERPVEMACGLLGGLQNVGWPLRSLRYVLKVTNVLLVLAFERWPVGRPVEFQV